ncbi:MAG: hypothetical protein WED04_03390 [Promethearchaeati archaeon SRVP18_Atabeyarchaeia-1]
MVQLAEIVGLLADRRKQIAEEMASLALTAGINEGGSRSAGCLRLEEVYCLKHGRKYGPYGPYYYLYFHRTSGMEKLYLGKSADQFVVRREALGRFAELEEEYKHILGLERIMLKGGR